jgi:hypothetical protein
MGQVNEALTKPENEEAVRFFFHFMQGRLAQGCQIFLDTMYQNGEKATFL